VLNQNNGDVSHLVVVFIIAMMAMDKDLFEIIIWLVAARSSCHIDWSVVSGWWVAIECAQGSRGNH
jgi:hypothetical protein